MLRLIGKGLQRFERFWLQRTDSRIYAAVRIAFALSALYNLLNLWPHRQELFSRLAMTDLATLQRRVAGKPYFSVFYSFSDPAEVTAIFALAALAMVCLAVGLFTRPAALLTFVFHLSYTYREVNVVHGWDVLLRVTALVVLFSPIGYEWTLDRKFQKYAPWRFGAKPALEKLGASTYCALSPAYGLVLLQLQLTVMYWTTVWQKLGDTFWRSGDMMGYYLMSMWSRYPSIFFADQFLLSQLTTYFTLLTEIAAPLLLFNAKYRWLGFCLGISLHVGIGLLSPLWEFSLAALTLYVAFLNGNDISRLAVLCKALTVRVGISGWLARLGRSSRCAAE